MICLGGLWGRVHYNCENEMYEYGKELAGLVITSGIVGASITIVGGFPEFAS